MVKGPVVSRSLKRREMVDDVKHRRFFSAQILVSKTILL